MKKKRKRYTQEFKEESIKLIKEQGYGIAEAARNLGINETLLGRWKRELEGVVKTLLADKRQPSKLNSPAS